VKDGKSLKSSFTCLTLVSAVPSALVDFDIRKNIVRFTYMSFLNKYFKKVSICLPNFRLH